MLKGQMMSNMSVHVSANGKICESNAQSESGQYAKGFSKQQRREGRGVVQRESTHLSWTSVEVPCGGAGVEEEGGAPEHTQKAGELQ
jgi:hypothetical protein